MTEQEENAYLRGERAALVRIMTECARQLGYEDPLAKAAFLIEQIESAKAKLREACEEFGDPDFEDDLHLADIIDNHLLDHLRSEEEGGG
jgi:hypothetical protein